VSDGYKIQNKVIDLRLRDGETILGVKAGLTSVAKQQAMGVNEPVYGFITDRMVLQSGTKVDLSRFIHPRVEPEIVFILSNDLSGSNVTKEDVLDSTESVCCGLEIIDSRYKDFRFTLADVVADNTSAAGFVLGEKMPTLDCD
jgi:2-oxo-3-hexenedioate decarboxylase